MAWFGKNKRADKSDTKTDGETGERALETLADILRTYGRVAFDTDCFSATELARHCESWARHLLTGSPPEGVGRIDKQTTPTNKRQWGELRRFIREKRATEQSYVGEHIDRLKAAIWDFVEGLNGMQLGDRTMEQRIRSNLGQLEGALQSNSLADVQALIRRTVGDISIAMEQRQQEHEKQMNLMGRRLKELRDDLQATKKQLEVDALTLVYNRGAFETALERYMRLNMFDGVPLLLMMIDLDHFKAINDTYGHPAGDQVLKAVADTIVRTFPRKNDFVARYGGEEFAVLLNDVTPEDAPRLAQRLLDKVAEIRVEYGQHHLEINCSIGYTVLTSADDRGSFVERADKALYLAKEVRGTFRRLT